MYIEILRETCTYTPIFRGKNKEALQYHNEVMGGLEGGRERGKRRGEERKGDEKRREKLAHLTPEQIHPLAKGHPEIIREPRASFPRARSHSLLKGSDFGVIIRLSRRNQKRPCGQRRRCGRPTLSLYPTLNPVRTYPHAKYRDILWKSNPGH